MKNQFILVYLLFSFLILFLNLQCVPAKLNGTCDPETPSFAMSALLEIGFDDGQYLCPLFGGLSNLRLNYSSDYIIVRQNETLIPIVPFSSEPIVHCESTPSLPIGLNLDESNCVISGTPIYGMNSTKYSITANSRTKQTTVPIIIKSLFIPKFAYVVNTTSGLVNSYSVNASSGLLNASGFVAAGGGPESMGISPSQKYLTVANRSSNDITQFTINQTNGSLTSLGNIPSGGNSPLAMTYHPHKDLVYIRNSDNVSTFVVNQATGTLAIVNTMPASPGASSIAVDPFGNYLYVPRYNEKLVDVFKVDSTTGIPNPNIIQTIGTGTNPRNLEILANGKNLYIVNDVDNNISSYRINPDNGMLETLGSATIAIGVNARSISADPTGRYIYMTYQGSESISIYKVDPSKGYLSQGIAYPVNQGNGPTGISIDSSGKYLYVTNFVTSNVDMFSINLNDGSLTHNGNVGTSTLPISIVTAGSNP
ncbi:lactonase family protein [Leptospira sp. 2 VSF19]|uniref:Lactonase family protein n=1 Tax=Leptospira soteropolitanensis TaxID=2950025 RepID=A0AAW5VHL8_9LEPT|nr:beta-propeller fold lactonase family protein [Leptospira soteropolitanensis]MCW7494642.1 lactonase family protein [Leptospira soteropolitanensis]MCW7502236.1 lactonase family protein [Leptospira soteropolitanensis]MCW7524484.1 lactonase family protein [Leptospira soteropolitanensis]MCW7528354.1 lactonase family protein [Leptospira soteropolitanensis]MCW7532203.1 lactonase family protein [Leptospira soteropolitanensis]